MAFDGDADRYRVDAGCDGDGGACDVGDLMATMRISRMVIVVAVIN